MMVRDGNRAFMLARRRKRLNAIDRLESRFYSGPMTANDIIGNELARLETRVDELTAV
jgi:hypothetical protein